MRRMTMMALAVAAALGGVAAMAPSQAEAAQARPAVHDVADQAVQPVHNYRGRHHHRAGRWDRHGGHWREHRRGDWHGHRWGRAEAGRRFDRDHWHRRDWRDARRDWHGYHRHW